jgi:hypothetical protein
MGRWWFGGWKTMGKWWFNDDFLWFNLGWTMVDNGMIWDTITMYNR